MSAIIHNILYIEDDENDRVLLEFACRHANLPVKIQTVNNGRAALDYLSGRGVYSDRDRYPFPALVLLDLKLPLQCGLEVLETMKQHPSTESLPVIVLTSSEQEEDRNRAMALGVKAYFIKPLDSEGLVEIMRQIYSEYLA